MISIIIPAYNEEKLLPQILEQFPPEDAEKPIVSVFGIQNRTKQHLDTESLADTIPSLR